MTDTASTCTVHSEELLSPLARIRSKVQAREARFKTLMKSTSCSIEDEKTLKQKLKHATLALKEKEVENERLKKELDRLQCEKMNSGGIRFFKKALSPASSTSSITVDSQVSKLEAELVSLQNKCRSQELQLVELKIDNRRKSDELENLKEERQDLLYVITGYEIDLETHNINYTNYMEEQHQLEEDALDEIFSNSMGEIAALEERHGCKTQQLITKLLSDYADMETRYKRDRAESSATVDRLEAETRELKQTIETLKGNTGINKRSSTTEKDDASYEDVMNWNVSDLNFLIHKLNDLEKKNKAMNDARPPIGNPGRQEKVNDSMIVNMGKLSEADSQHGDDVRGEQDLYTEYFEKRGKADVKSITSTDELKKLIRERDSLIVRFKSQYENQTRKLAALRSRVIDLRLNDRHADGDSNEYVRHGTDQAKEDFVVDYKELQEQLQSLKRILHTKDKELSEERRKFASRRKSTQTPSSTRRISPARGVSGRHAKFSEVLV